MHTLNTVVHTIVKCCHKWYLMAFFIMRMKFCRLVVVTIVTTGEHVLTKPATANPTPLEFTVNMSQVSRHDHL